MPSIYNQLPFHLYLFNPNSWQTCGQQEQMCDDYWNVVYLNKRLLFLEGQLPRGALYLDHKMNSKEAEKSYVSPNDICKSLFMELRPLT